jgi:hypothetical protein
MANSSRFPLKVALALLALGASPAFADGTIPLTFNFGRPSTDLADTSGRIIPIGELQTMANAKQVDLSTLNPDATSTLWKNVYPGGIPPTARELDLATTSSGQYLSGAAAPFETFKITIQVKNAKGVPEVRTVTLGRSIHNNLLRKAILRKIGYTLPPSAWIPNVTIRFADSVEKKLFVDDLERATASNSNDWIISGGDADITVKDALITEDQDQIYNLATGYLNQSIVAGRRLLSSTYVANALANVPESINIFAWEAGTVSSGEAALDFPNEDDFGPSYEDARWITGRLAHLTRNDWDQITASIQIPEAPRLLLEEKLISRRNSLVALFAVTPFDETAPENSFQADVTSADDPNQLKNGKLLQQNYVGYACRFAFGDPDNPLNPGEVWAFAKSKIFGLVLANAVGKLNALPFFHTDDKDLVDQHQAENLQKQFETYQKTGQIQRSPLKAWAYGTASGQLIFSREIVTGSYLGTNDLLQLADTFGLRGTGGVTIGIDGLPTAYSASISGKVELSRTYTHLIPMKSIQKANHYGFQNAVVPLLIRDAARKLNPLFSGDFNKLPADQKLTEYGKVLEEFKSKLGIGESIIITDSIVPSLGASVGVGLGKLVEVTAAAQASELILHRLQIYRSSENEFQIYNDDAHAFRPSFSLGLSFRKQLPQLGGGTFFVSDLNALNYAKAPILGFSWSGNNGKATVEFFPLTLSTSDDDLGTNLKTLAVLQKVVSGGSLALLRKDNKPYRLENTFHEKEVSDNFLFFNYRRLRSSVDLKLTRPDGAEQSYIRDTFGETIGKNYENTATDTLSFFSQLYTHADFDFSDDHASNPGYTIKGSAKNSILQYEAEKAKDGTLSNRFVKLTHIFNGWSISKADAQKKLDKFSADYGSTLIPPLALHETDKIFLYSISANIHLYEPALAHLAALTADDISKIYQKAGVSEGNAVDRIYTNLQQFAKNGTAKDLLRGVSIADRQLPVESFYELFGGRDNLFIYAEVDGFRKGDENGDSHVLTETIGLVGSKKAEGPISDIQKRIGMTEGEFLATWITGRLL